MKPLRLVIPALAVCALLFTAWELRTSDDSVQPNRAWGNVETRQTSLAFEASGRILRLQCEEGDRVEAGAELGRLDVKALEIQRRLAQAKLKQAAAQASLAHEGTRKEDIDALRAAESAAGAQVKYAAATLARQSRLVGGGATSRQAVDEARYALDAANESLASAKAQRIAGVAGLRPQEVDSADAALEAAQAELDALDYQINTASVLIAPSAGVIRAKLAEPGDMASASRTVYQLSVVDPKWIRAYVTERQLGLVKEGAKALVTTDTTKPIEGIVSFIASTAEFTPKTVQTEDLRSSLVYEVRITVADPENVLRLGQPVTVDFEP